MDELSVEVLGVSACIAETRSNANLLLLVKVRTVFRSSVTEGRILMG